MHRSSRPAACRSLPTASTFSLRLADRNYEDRMPSQKEPAQAVPAIEYTVESANWLIAELRAIPPKDPAKRKLDKQRMVSLLAGELIALQQRGYTIEEVAESLRGRGLAITTPTLKNYLQRAKSKTEKRAKSGARTASGAVGQRDAKDGEARGVERARARDRLRRHPPQSRRRARRRRARRRRPRRSAAARERFS